MAITKIHQDQDLTVAGMLCQLSHLDYQAVTIADGSITPSGAYNVVVVTGEGGNADTLDTIDASHVRKGAEVLLVAIDYITFSRAGNLSISFGGGGITPVLGPGTTAGLVYDGTNWVLDYDTPSTLLATLYERGLDNNPADSLTIYDAAATGSHVLYANVILGQVYLVSVEGGYVALDEGKAIINVDTDESADGAQVYYSLNDERLEVDLSSYLDNGSVLLIPTSDGHVIEVYSDSAAATGVAIYVEDSGSVGDGGVALSGDFTGAGTAGDVSVPVSLTRTWATPTRIVVG